MIKDFRTLEVWQLAHKLTIAVYRSSTSFPAEEKFGLTSQIRRCSVSIEANIAEGCGRGGDQDFRRFLLMALGSASELDCELLLARDLEMLSLTRYQELSSAVVSIKAMLATLARKIETDLAKAAAVGNRR
jgi:four helix bundle protein